MSSSPKQVVIVRGLLCWCMVYGEALVAAVLHVTFNLTRRFVYNGTRVKFVDDLICILLDGGALPGICMNAGKLGLVIITVERYLKIVHAVAHRSHYRGWMTSAGAALPWISGLCLALFPGIATTRIVNGTCRRMGVWPNRAAASVTASNIYSLSVITSAVKYKTSVLSAF